MVVFSADGQKIFAEVECVPTLASGWLERCAREIAFLNNYLCESLLVDQHLDTPSVDVSHVKSYLCQTHLNRVSALELRKGQQKAAQALHGDQQYCKQRPSASVSVMGAECTARGRRKRGDAECVTRTHMRALVCFVAKRLTATAACRCSEL